MPHVIISYTIKFILQFHFHLCYEVKRVLSVDEPLEEMDGTKRLWMKDPNMTYEIYKDHLTPTVFNTNLKVLTTKHYIPEYLKKIFSKKMGRLKEKYTFFFLSKND